MSDEDRTPDESETEPGEAAAEQPGQEPRTEPTAVLGQAPPRRRLLRSRDDRMVAGVAGGLADYFSVDPVIVRIAFAVSVFFGGLGALAYLALTLFVPAAPATGEAGERPLAPVERSRWLAIGVGIVVAVLALSAAGSLFFWDWGWGWDGGGPWGLLVLLAIGAAAYALLRERDRSPREGSPRAAAQPRGAGRVAALVVIAIVASCGLAGVALLAAFATATGSGVLISIMVIAIGALLALAAFAGGARWLIAPALALAIPLGVVSAADISFAGGVGDRLHRPTANTVLPDRYEHGVGRMIVDLRELEWSDSQAPVSLEVDLGVGEAVVLIPEQVCVEPDLHVGIGQIELGRNTLGSGSLEGIDLDQESIAGADSGPSLELEGEVDLGALRVLNDYREHHGPPFGRDERGDRARIC